MAYCSLVSDVKKKKKTAKGCNLTEQGSDNFECDDV